MPPRRSSPSTDLPTVNPLTRVSEHFNHAAFLGNHTVYSQGFSNMMVQDAASLPKMDNLTALALHGLEPIIANWGGLSISYGYISPEMSRQIVKYQDPNIPSHHRFDLGAAADICVHDWVCNHKHPYIEDLFLPESVVGSPIALAHAIDQADIPYSRLITYSESPYLCLAVSSTEVYRKEPRKAFYENRYQGRKGSKPEYIQLSSQNARNRHFAQLQDQGLEVPWQGHGYPTYHGGGRRQYHHMRVSRHTVVSDWLLDLQSIAIGAKNIPALSDERVQDAFAAAGTVYDWIVEKLGIKRMSITAGYVAASNPSFDPSNDWREDAIDFDIVGPQSLDQTALSELFRNLPNGAYAEKLEHGGMRLKFLKNEVLDSPEWDL